MKSEPLTYTFLKHQIKLSLIWCYISCVCVCVCVLKEL